jgi:hypothetical protein
MIYVDTQDAAPDTSRAREKDIWQSTQKNITATKQKHFVNSKVVTCSQIRTYGGIFMFGYVCVGLGIVTGLIGTHLFTRWLGQILPGRKGDRYEKAT